VGLAGATRARPGPGATCSPYDDGTAAWGSTPTNTPNVAGACDAGYVQTNGQPPTRTCNSDLSWSPATNACTRTFSSAAGRLLWGGADAAVRESRARGTPTGLVCDSTTDASTHAFFNDTLSGEPTTGACLPGYSGASTPPSRTCLLTGVWSDVTGTCSRTSAAAAAAGGGEGGTADAHTLPQAR